MTASELEVFGMLKFRDTYLADLVSSKSEDFEPKYNSKLGELDIQTRAFIDSSEIIIPKEEASNIFKVSVNFGVRWSTDCDVSEEDMDIRAIIECKLIAEYVITEEVTQDQLDNFAMNNVIIDVWPYWRELLRSQCARMHLTGVKLPSTPRL
jgi:hypothetical protein